MQDFIENTDQKDSFLQEHYAPQPGTVSVLVGLQYGDEGKGKNVDILSSMYDIVARWQGGPNSGHTVDGGVLRMIPSGALREGCKLFLGANVAINPIILSKEIYTLIEKRGIDIRPRLFIAPEAKLILPTHIWEDALSEFVKGDKKIGSTQNGMTPLYVADVARNGIRVGDLLKNGYMEKIDGVVNESMSRIYKIYNSKISQSSKEGRELLEFKWKLYEQWKQSLDIIHSEMIVSSTWILDQLEDGKTVLAEGAQATWLDITIGDYPFVTSSNTTAGSVCVGLNIPPQKIQRIYGVIKAYDTRVGGGPFITEFEGTRAEEIRKKGGEFGSSTGRPRRIGWLDLQRLRDAIRINGVTHLMVNKLDVLNNLPFEVIESYNSHNPKMDLKVKQFNNTEITERGKLNAEANLFLSYLSSFLEQQTSAHLMMIGSGPKPCDFILNRRTHRNMGTPHIS